MKILRQGGANGRLCGSGISRGTSPASHFRFLVHAPVAVGRAQDSSQGLCIAHIFLWDTLLSESDFASSGSL